MSQFEDPKKGLAEIVAFRADLPHVYCKGYIKNGKIDKREKLFGGKTWYSTGDRGIRDKDGYFWFVGRDDDVIVSMAVCTLEEPSH